MTAPGGRARGLPIAVQVGILLMASLLAAQAVSVLLLFLSPPPPPPVYETAEIAQALRGGSLDTRFGRRLQRTVQAGPPSGQDFHGPREEATRRTLASLLQVPQGSVRYFWLGRPEERPGARRRFHHELDRRPMPPPGAPPGFPPPSDAPPALQLQPGAGPGPGSPGPIRMPGSMVIGEFVAGVQRADGRWTQVRSPHESLFSPWRRRMVFWLLSCLVVVAPAAYLFARRITAPIDRFAKAAQALGRDPGATPLQVSGPAEIGAAAVAFNDMQARIRRYVDDRTAMVSAISHDLRTPLARIRYKLEGGPEPLKVQVLTDVERMEQMIGQVLAFIRDASEPRQRERLDLLSVVECVADEAVQTGGKVEIGHVRPLAVTGDGLALQRMLTNLVDNAVKYGGGAHIDLSQTGGEAVIEVRDDGPGLPEGELERVFKPFYRPNAARTLDDRGVGLGLSVARSIARAHGGEVDLRPGPEKGLIARVRLPLAPEPAKAKGKR
jgi:signal transduction histidine kinase